MDRIFDVAIVGGGPAGLTAAVWLARYLHSVVVIDSGDPRNWETRGVNGFLGLPRIRPGNLRALGREECRSYGVELVDDIVVAVSKPADDEFSLQQAEGAPVRAACFWRSVFATSGPTSRASSILSGRTRTCVPTATATRPVERRWSSSAAAGARSVWRST